ncbi:MAG: carbonic anhydrase family protein [Desulfobulbaceae bacterium]
MKKYISKAALALGTLVFSAGIAGASGGTAHWGYSGAEGPANWGHLTPEYEMCAKGKNQSPIDISGMIEAELQPISFSYTPSPLDVVNNGHTIKQSFAPGSSITVDGHTYNLLQVHWHTPSENHINGRSFPMEAHLVHADKDGNLAVIGVMYNTGAENSGIKTVWDKIPAKVGEAVKNPNAMVDPMALLPADRDYYRFNGSLTTPPCSEGVRWMVMKQPVEASAAQIEQFHSTFHGDTNRPVQPVNARPVLQ